MSKSVKMAGKGFIHGFEEGNGAAKYDEVKVQAMDRAIVSSKRSKRLSSVTPLQMRPIIVKDL